MLFCCDEMFVEQMNEEIDVECDFVEIERDFALLLHGQQLVQVGDATGLRMSRSSWPNRENPAVKVSGVAPLRSRRHPAHQLR